MDHPHQNLPSSSSYALQINSDHTNSDATRPNRLQSNLDDCVLRLMLVLLSSFLIFSFVSVIAWLVIDPRDPSFRINSLSISNITVSDSRFTASYDMELAVNNTNKKANLVIDHVKIRVFYGKAIISERVLEETSIYVPRMGQKKLKVVLNRDSVQSIKLDVFKDVSDDWSKKIVNFNVEMLVRTKYELGAWPSKKRFFHVRCMALTVEFLSTKGTGKLMSAGKGCLLNLN